MNINVIKMIGLLSVFYYTSVLGQDFAPIGAQWYFPETFAFSPNKDIISYQSIGDTIIDGKSFRIIEKDKWSCLLRFGGRQLIHQQNDSIFHLNSETNDLNLIIDFGALPGESWYINKYSEFDYSDGMQCFVDSLGTLEIDNQTLSVQYVTLKPVMNNEIMEGYPMSTMIIENIGFQMALFPVSFQGICDGNFEGELRCYEDDNLGLLKFSEEDCLMTSTSDLTEILDVKIYPNPTNSIFNISVDDQKKIQQIEVFDLSGKMLIRKQIGNQTGTQINAKNLKDGIYVINVTTDEAFVIKKVIVNK